MALPIVNASLLSWSKMSASFWIFPRFFMRMRWKRNLLLCNVSQSLIWLGKKLYWKLLWCVWTAIYLLCWERDNSLDEVYLTKLVLERCAHWFWLVVVLKFESLESFDIFFWAAIQIIYLSHWFLLIPSVWLLITMVGKGMCWLHATNSPVASFVLKSSPKLS